MSSIYRVLVVLGIAGLIAAALIIAVAVQNKDCPQGQHEEVVVQYMPVRTLVEKCVDD